MGKRIPLQQRIQGFNKYRDSGLFKSGFGGKGIDGANFACEAYNSFFGTKIRSVSVSLNDASIYGALVSGSPINTGIKYGKEYFKNEQDDGIIQNTSGTTGFNGHWISIVVMNTSDPNRIQVKFVENYDGIPRYQIIYLGNFAELRVLFMNGGVYYMGK